MDKNDGKESITKKYRDIFGKRKKRRSKTHGL